MSLTQCSLVLEVAVQGLQKNPDIQFFNWCQVACLVQLERVDQAQAVADRFMMRLPEFRLSKWRQLNLNRTLGEDVIALTEAALRRVGVPE